MAVGSLLNNWNEGTADTQFQYRVAAALISTAIAVQGEPANTPSHTARSAYALRVLANPMGFAQVIAPGIAVYANIDNSATDQQLKDNCSAVWNAYSVQG